MHPELADLYCLLGAACPVCGSTILNGTFSLSLPPTVISRHPLQIFDTPATWVNYSFQKTGENDVINYLRESEQSNKL